MNYKNNLSAVVIIFGILVSGSIIGSALAQRNPFDIQFPVKELGDCKDQAACKVYCDEPKNVDACLDFAQKNNLASKEDVEMAKKFKDKGLVGPGGCKGQIECDKYCGNPDNMSECISFAEKNGLMPPEQLKEARKVQAAIARGIKPPACGGKEACDAYCGSPEHMEECMNFAIEAGMMSGKELDDSKKVLQAIKKGIKPPACKGKEECDAYCGSPEHMEECVNFSIEAGMMPEQDRENSQKMLQAIKKGVKPPACKSKEECDTYCSEESHIDECMNFAEAAGFMNAKEAEMARKTRGKGPGGCRGPEECRKFCDNPDNQETCFQFGKDNGMIPEEDLRRMDEGRKGMKESFNQMPQEVLDCLTSSLGADAVDKIKAGTAMLGPKTGNAMRECFEKFPPQGQFDQGQPGQPGQRGPNNMSGDLRECIQAQIGEDGLAKIQSGQMDDPALMEKAKPCFEKYGQQGQQRQSDQQNQNQQGQPGQNQQGQPGNNFQPGPGVINQGGQQMPQQAGPGGCKGPEECQKYCASNPEECKNFQPSAEGQSGRMAPGTFQGAPGNIVCEDPAKCPQVPQAGESFKSIERRDMPPCEGENCVQRSSSDQGGIFQRTKNAFMPNTQEGQRPIQGQEGAVQPSQISPQGTNTSGQYIRGQAIPNESNPSPAPMPTPSQPGTYIQGQSGQWGNQAIPNESNPSPAPMPTPGQPGTYIQGQSGQFGGQIIPNESNPSPAPMPTPSQPGTYIQQNQTGQIAPGGIAPIEGGIAPQQISPPIQQQAPPPPPSSFIQRLLGSVIDLFRK